MPITDVELAPSDVAAVVFGLGAASLDLASGHKIFGLNNMIACLIATDILQVAPKLGSMPSAVVPSSLFSGTCAKPGWACVPVT